MNLLNLQGNKEEMILIMNCSLEHLLILCNSEFKIKHNLYLWNGKQLDYFKKKYDCLIITSDILSSVNGAQKLCH